jgi:hypothetical protein
MAITFLHGQLRSASNVGSHCIGMGLAFAPHLELASEPKLLQLAAGVELRVARSLNENGTSTGDTVARTAVTQRCWFDFDAIRHGKAASSVVSLPTDANK